MKKESWHGKKVALIGAPTDIGAGRRGGSMGPEALRVARIEQSLRNLGLSVIDTGNLSGPINPEEESIDGVRHLPETVKWCEAVREAYYHSLLGGDFPVLMGGDHSLAIGSIAGVAQYCAQVKKKLNIIWLDAHADFNTPSTTPSGNIHGMPVAVNYGVGHPELVNIIKSRPHAPINHMVQVGIRSVDTLERSALNRHNITLFDMRRIDEERMRGVMEQTLKLVDEPDTHVHVSFDVDFLDPSIAPGVATTVRGGPNYREAQLCMEMIHDAGIMASLDLMELNPAYDNQNQSAQLMVELVESLFGKQVIARSPVH